MTDVSSLSAHRTELLMIKADLIRDIGAANAATLDKDISECDRLIELAIISAPNADRFARLPLNIGKISEGYRILDSDGNHVLDIHDEPTEEVAGLSKCLHASIASKLMSDGTPCNVCTTCGSIINLTVVNGTKR